MNNNGRSLLPFTTKQPPMSSTDHGGGKRVACGFVCCSCLPHRGEEVSPASGQSQPHHRERCGAAYYKSDRQQRSLNLSQRFCAFRGSRSTEAFSLRPLGVGQCLQAARSSLPVRRARLFAEYMRNSTSFTAATNLNSTYRPAACCCEHLPGASCEGKKRGRGK